MPKARTLFGSSLVVSGSVCLIVAALVVLCRFLGAFESWELSAYDSFLHFRPKVAALDSRIVLIEIDENDIRTQWRWPLTDAALVQVLQTLKLYRPRAIGVDIFRDMPVFPGYEELGTMLKGNDNIIMVMKASDSTSEGVPPPAIVKNTDQIGFSDILVDADGTVRRGLLFLGEKGKTVYSFALRLALRYLQTEGVNPQPCWILSRPRGRFPLCR
jgi:adenylate cyclase